MATKHFPTLSDDRNILIGDGMLFLGEDAAVYDDEALENAGCLWGTAVFRPKVDVVELPAGAPQVAIDRQPTKFTAQLEVTLVEMDLRKMQKAFGFGTYTTGTTTTEAIVDEQVYLSNYYFQHLQNHAILDSPAVVVTDGAATPTTFTEDDDYEIDYTTGLIRRVTDSTITDNSTVYVTYSYTKPATKIFRSGVDASLAKRPLKFIVPMPNGEHWILKFWRATCSSIGDMNFQADDFTKVTLTFDALADRTKTADRMLYEIVMEY